MRRRFLILGIFIALVAVMIFGTACLAGAASVTVQVTIAPVIHVNGNAVVPTNVNVVRQIDGHNITYITP